MLRALPRWLVLWLFAIGLILGSREVLSAESLIRQVSVTDEIVRLGDLFEGLPAHKAATAVAKAPAPGREARVSARWLAKLAQTHGLDDMAAMVEPVIVRRLGARIEAAPWYRPVFMPRKTQRRGQAREA